MLAFVDIICQSGINGAYVLVTYFNYCLIAIY